MRSDDYNWEWEPWKQIMILWKDFSYEPVYARWSPEQVNCLIDNNTKSRSNGQLTHMYVEYYRLHKKQQLFFWLLKAVIYPDTLLSCIITALKSGID